MKCSLKGSENELIFASSLNNKSLNNLNYNLKKFILFLFPNIKEDDQIKCERINDNSQKADLIIWLNDQNIKKYISLKIGLGNSVHQEKLDDFASWLKTQNVNNEIINNIKLFHFGDGTLDGSGEIRLRSNQLIKTMNHEISEINRVFNSKDLICLLIKRFLFKGVNENNLGVDIVYHGDINYGAWATSDEVINYLLKNEINKNNIHIGPMIYQPWNRDYAKTNKHPNRRYMMQIKFSSLSKILWNIRHNINYQNDKKGWNDGVAIEIDFVNYFNHNKDLFDDYLSKFSNDKNQLWMVRITSNQRSSLSNKKVKTRETLS